MCEESSEEGNPDVNLYVHHDIILPAFPLALAWMDCSILPGALPSDKGATDLLSGCNFLQSLPHPLLFPANLVAVGTMDPGIEIWDLDVVS